MRCKHLNVTITKYLQSVLIFRYTDGKLSDEDESDDGVVGGDAECHDCGRHFTWGENSNRPKWVSRLLEQL